MALTFVRDLYGVKMYQVVKYLGQRSFQSYCPDTLIHTHTHTHTRDGTGSPGHGSLGQRFWPGRVRVSVSDQMFDPVWSFNMCVFRGIVSTEQHPPFQENIICIISCRLL